MAQNLPQNFEQRASASHQESQSQQETISQVDSELSASAFDLDSVLDDIESTLEENAQEYVNSFVQKGGE